jgi:hypothetical protein
MRDFGAPLAALGVRERDFTVPGTVVQMGLPPRRIDLMTSITAVEFGQAWATRLEVDIADVTVPLLGRECLLANKRALGRPRDLADVDALTGGAQSAP